VPPRRRCDALTDINTGAVWNTNAVATATRSRCAAPDLYQSATAGALRVCTSRIAGRLQSDGSAWTSAVVGASQLDNLIVDTYYIDRNSAQLAGLPSLRRKTLTSAGGVVQFRDQEIIPGVEDLQVQFGIDPPGNTVGPATSIKRRAAGAQIVASHLAACARHGRNGFTDSRVWYGDRLQAGGVTGDLNAAAGAGLAYQLR
jgi:hypothetical protein